MTPPATHRVRLHFKVLKLLPRLETAPVTGGMMGLAVDSKIVTAAASRRTRSACRCRSATGSRSSTPA
jgi:hypothetical protein